VSLLILNWKKEVIKVRDMSEEEWEIYNSDPVKNWNMKHPFMLGEDFCGRDDYNLKLKEMCEEKTHSLVEYRFIINK